MASLLRKASKIGAKKIPNPQDNFKYKVGDELIYGEDGNHWFKVMEVKLGSDKIPKMRLSVGGPLKTGQGYGLNVGYEVGWFSMNDPEFDYHDLKI